MTFFDCLILVALSLSDLQIDTANLATAVILKTPATALFAASVQEDLEP
jgi:hypothetical protein